MAFVLIIGAKSDMAMALAREFSAGGYDLYLAGRQIEDLDAFGRDIRVRTGRNVVLRECDVANFGSHSSFYSSLEEKPLGVIVCAGYMPRQQEAETDWEKTLNTIQVNYTGCISLLNIIANDFETRSQGFIIGISSVAGDRGRKTNYIYGSAKAGFTAFLSGLRNRLHSKKVQVLTIKPGFVHTRMTSGMDLPKPLTARPEQVAKQIFRAREKGKDTLYTLWMWQYIMLIIRHIPEFVFKRLSL